MLIRIMTSLQIMKPWEIYFENIGYWDCFSLDLGIYRISLWQPCSVALYYVEVHGLNSFTYLRREFYQLINL